MEGYSLDLLSPSLVNSIHFPFVALSQINCSRFAVRWAASASVGALHVCVHRHGNTEVLAFFITGS